MANSENKIKGNEGCLALPSAVLRPFLRLIGRDLGDEAQEVGDDGVEIVQGPRRETVLKGMDDLEKDLDFILSDLFLQGRTDAAPLFAVDAVLQGAIKNNLRIALSLRKDVKTIIQSDEFFKLVMSHLTTVRELVKTDILYRKKDGGLESFNLQHLINEIDEELIYHITGGYGGGNISVPASDPTRKDGTTVVNEITHSWAMEKLDEIFIKYLKVSIFKTITIKPETVVVINPAPAESDEPYRREEALRIVADVNARKERRQRRMDMMSTGEPLHSGDPDDTGKDLPY